MRSIILVVLSATPWAFAEGEGQIMRPDLPQTFSRQMPAKQYQAAWNNTFMLFSETSSSRNWGTVFVVDKFSTKKHSYITVLTAGHVISLFGEGGRLFLLKEASLRERLFAGLKVNSLTNIPMMPLQMGVAKKWDVGSALLRISHEDAKSIEPVVFADRCDLDFSDPVLTIGFPNTRAIKYHRSPEPGDNLANLTKRWSEGVYLGDRESSDDIENIYGTTVDTTGGGSGGPLLNSRGHVVGLVSHGRDTEIYKGSSKPGALYGQSYVADCEAIKVIRDDSVTQGKSFIESYEDFEAKSLQPNPQ